MTLTDPVSGTLVTAPIKGFKVDFNEARISLLLPAIQAAREAARRMRKTNCGDQQLSDPSIESVPGTEAEPNMRFNLEDARLVEHSSGSVDTTRGARLLPLRNSRLFYQDHNGSL